RHPVETAGLQARLDLVPVGGVDRGAGRDEPDPAALAVRRAAQVRRDTCRRAGAADRRARGGGVRAMPTKPSRALETFPNPAPGRDYVIHHECPEYTALCPVTGQPDFGTIVLEYVPEKKCVELKSFKLYIWSFRDEGHFFEQVTNQICDELVKALSPRRL